MTQQDVIMYNQIVKAYRHADSRQNRCYHKKKAQEKFPGIFSEEDFPRKTDKRRRSYKNLVRDFREAGNDVQRNNIRVISRKMYPEIFNPSDFPAKKNQPVKDSRGNKVYTQKTKYKDLINAFNKETSGPIRGCIKNRAKKLFPETFRESDFPKRKTGRKPNN